jgi:hypothetical protein
MSFVRRRLRLNLGLVCVKFCKSVRGLVGRRIVFLDLISSSNHLTGVKTVGRSFAFPGVEKLISLYGSMGSVRRATQAEVDQFLEQHGHHF